MKINIKNQYILLIIIISIAPKSFAKDIFFNISTSFLHANINDPDYEYIDDYENIFSVRSVNVGISYKVNDYIFNINTNRLYNPAIKKDVRQKRTGLVFLNESVLTADSIQIGKLFNKFSPSLMFINLELEKSLYYNNIMVGSNITNSILKGINLTYFLSKKLSCSFFYILPDKKIFLENAIGLSLTLNF